MPFVYSAMRSFWSLNLSRALFGHKWEAVTEKSKKPSIRLVSDAHVRVAKHVLVAYPRGQIGIRVWVQLVVHLVNYRTIPPQAFRTVKAV